MFGVSDGVDFAVAGGIVVFEDLIVTGGDDYAVFDDDRAEWPAVAVFDAGFCFGDCKFHEMWVVHS